MGFVTSGLDITHCLRLYDRGSTSEGSPLCHVSISPAITSRGQQPSALQHLKLSVTDARHAAQTCCCVPSRFSHALARVNAITPPTCPVRMFTSSPANKSLSPPGPAAAAAAAAAVAALQLYRSPSPRPTHTPACLPRPRRQIRTRTLANCTPTHRMPTHIHAHARTCMMNTRTLPCA
eukprot:6213254-Pleurochrysis_carterae.AAC.4